MSDPNLLTDYFHIPNCHNCLQSALYQLEKPVDSRNVEAAIAAIKAAQKSLAQVKNN